jgi:hypothetical protein
VVEFDGLLGAIRMNSFVNDFKKESTQSSLLAHINQESPALYISSVLYFYEQDDWRTDTARI